jgi:hypothetical protein
LIIEYGMSFPVLTGARIASPGCGFHSTRRPLEVVLPGSFCSPCRRTSFRSRARESFLTCSVSRHHGLFSRVSYGSQ